MGGIVGINCSVTTELMTGVAADVGTGSGGGCSGDGVCPPSSTRTTSETGTNPGIHVDADSSGTVYPGDSAQFPKLGSQVQHTQPPSTAAAPQIPPTARSEMASLRRPTSPSLSLSRNRPNGSAVPAGGITGATI